MNITHLKVSTRLGLGFGAVLLMLAITVGISIYSLGKLADNSDDIVTESYPKVLQAQQVMNHHNKIARSLRNALLIHDEAKAAKEIATVMEKRKDNDAAMQKLGDTIKTSESRAFFNAVQAAHKPFNASLDEVLRLRSEGDINGAVDQMLGQMRALQLAYMDAIDALIAHQSANMEKARVEAEETYIQSRNLAIALGLAALALGAALAWLISRQLLRQLGGEPTDVTAIAGQIAGGDLAVQISLRAGDEHSLLFAIQGMRDSLSEIVGQAGATMDRIVAAVKSVTDIMGEISNASSEQEAGIEQINHAIAEMDTVTQQNAALVEQAAAAAEAQQDQAHQLVQLVGVFTLATDQRTASHLSAQAARAPQRKPSPLSLTHQGARHALAAA
jgi:methyl-accepting chemotaxis protein